MVESYGDCIAPGKYTIHSRFAKVINYTCGDSLLSLVGEDIGNGPSNVVFIEIPTVSDDRLIVGEGTLRLEGRAFPLDAARMYVSTLPAVPADPAALGRNLAHCARIVREESPPLSWAFLLDRRRERHFVSSFERALLERVNEGWRRMREGDAPGGVRFLSGAGYGFTPSGDDFIAGYLGGLHLVQWFFHADVAESREAIHSACVTENPVSDSFIRHSMNGRFSEKVKTSLVALLQDGSSAVEGTVRRVLSLGETSGADFMTGLVCALKLYGY